MGLITPSVSLAKRFTSKPGATLKEASCCSGVRAPCAELVSARPASASRDNRIRPRAERKGVIGIGIRTGCSSRGRHLASARPGFAFAFGDEGQPLFNFLGVPAFLRITVVAARRLHRAIAV